MQPRSSLNSAVRAGGSAWGALSLSTAPQQRLFSASRPRQVHVISFSKTSSPELDDILKTVRENIIMPQYLKSEQRKKLYRFRYKDKLKTDPVTLEVDGVEYKFGFKDPSTDLPSTRKSVMGAVQRMEKNQDWVNLPKLLEGCYSLAGRKWDRYYDMAVIARRAGRQGRIQLILELARAVDRTGFQLDNAELVMEVMFWIQREAWADGWADKEAVVKALGRADMVTEMLEFGNHQPPAGKAEKVGVAPPGQALGLPLKHDPKVLAVPLHLRAALAVKFADHRTEAAQAELKGRVERLARGVVAGWPEGKGLLGIHPAPRSQREGKSFIYNPCGLLRVGAPMLSALQMAIEVVSPEVAAQLRPRRDALAAELDGILSDPSEGGFVGRTVYDELFGTDYAAQYQALNPDQAANEAEA